MSRILVTGATGFVGSRLVRELVRRGERVKVLARPGSSVAALSGLTNHDVEVVTGDITIEQEVFRALAGCDRLYHVAAVFKMWARDRQDILDGAIVGTEATLSAASKRRIDRVVVTSSVAAVGVSETTKPLDEDSAFTLEDPETYIIAKRRAEERALTFAAKGLPVVVVNPGAIYGPGDWKPTPSGQSILAYLSWRWPLGFPCSEGGINVVDVDDIVSGHILAMDRGKIGERYILGGENITYEQLFQNLAEITGLRGPGAKTGKGGAVAMGTLLEALAWVTGDEPPLTRRLARDYVGRYAWFSNKKACRDLGWKARRAKETLHRAVSWFVENGYVDDTDLRRIRLSPWPAEA